MLPGAVVRPSYRCVVIRICTSGFVDDVMCEASLTLGRMLLDKSLNMWLQMLLSTLFNGSVHTSHM